MTDLIEARRSRTPSAASWPAAGTPAHRLGIAHYNYGDTPRLLAQLEIELADGTTQTVGTDGSWKTAFGPFIEGELLAGETYDARKEIAGWDRPALDTRPGAGGDRRRSGVARGSPCQADHRTAIRRSPQSANAG